MYKSPIELVYDISNDLQIKMDETIVKAVCNVGVNVDRNRLIKALRFDKGQYEQGEWDMFELITSVWHGKNYYFMQDNGTIYSRDSGEYMSFDEAVHEFLKRIGD